MGGGSISRSGPIRPGLVIEEAGRRSLRFQQSLRRHRQEIDKFPAPPKKARVSYPLAAFATREPALPWVPLVSENERYRKPGFRELGMPEAHVPQPRVASSPTFDTGQQLTAARLMKYTPCWGDA